MPAGYAPLPNPRSEPDADRELEDAFDDHEDDEHSPTETTHLTHRYPADSHPLSVDSALPPAGTPQPPHGAYDFEREYEYDFPPPGSPPSPSAFALPNEIGNSNGQLPATPQLPEPPRPSFFRRVVGVLLPQHYARVPTEAPAAPRGGGIENDGVFANVMAKPARSVAVTNDNGEVIMVLEDSQNDLPPSYQEAQADAVPPYWETTVMAPAIMSIGGDMIVDELPTGSLIFFISTAFVSYFFQFVGFVLTYLLHTTHAAKHGSRAGLGLTMIQYGFSSRMRAAQDEGEGEVGQDLIMWNATTGLPEVIHKTGPGQAMLPNGTVIDISAAEWNVGSRDWMSFLLIIIGWFLLIASIIGFYRVKRWEKSIRRAANPPTTRTSTTEQVQQDVETRRNIERVFGIYDYSEHAESPTPTTAQLSEAESRLQRDLREAGLL